MMRISAILLAAVASAVLTSPAVAQRHNREHSPAAPRGFSSAEREAIVAYFKGHPTDVKPLPPGIVKRLQRGKPLPPGIAKRQLPAPLVEHLPERTGTEADVEITIFGDRVVLLEASGLVVDILEGVFGT